MRILLIGDIVGKPGERIVTRALPGLRRREGLDLVIANAENAADGSGLAPSIYRKLLAAGVDCVTLGDHIYRRSEIVGVLTSAENIAGGRDQPLGPHLHAAGRLSVDRSRPRAGRDPG
jgi:calcineurin-like phosphoesterase